MSNEVRVTSSLQIQGGNAAPLQYQSRPTSFVGNISKGNGPTPGVIAATLAGTDVNLSQLATPGYCRIMNLDPTNYVEVGVYDPDTAEFYPLFEVLPGETYPCLLSRQLGSEQSGTGTGPSGSGVTLRIKATVAPCDVLVEAFDR